MPALPRLTTEAMRALAERLRYVPPEAARRQLVRAEALAAEVMEDVHVPGGAGAERAYPVSWIYWRITGYRDPTRALGMEPGDEGDAAENNDAGGDAGVLVGAALLGDLASYIEHVSHAARLTEPEPSLESEAPPTKPIGKRGRSPSPRRSRGGRAGSSKVEPESAWYTLEDLCERWGVSRKSIERWRKRGLWSRRIGLPREESAAAEAAHRGGHTKRAGLGRSAFAASTVERFERLVRSHAGELDGSSSPRGKPAQSRPTQGKRLPAEQRRRIIRHTERYRRVLGWPLMRACRRLAERMGVSAETIRRTVRGGPQGPESAVAGTNQAGPASAPRTRAIRSDRTAELRASRTAELRLLRSLRPGQLIVGPTFEREGASEVLLAPESVRAGFRPGLPSALPWLIAEARGSTAPDARVESQRAVAYWYLLWRSERRLAELTPRTASANAIDRVKTDLLWAARLFDELVRSQLGLMLRSIESALGEDARIEQLPDDAAGDAFAEAVHATGKGAARFDPFKGGRLAAPVGLSLGRELAEWLEKNRVASRRMARRIEPTHGPDAAVWQRAFGSLTAWRGIVEPSANVRAWTTSAGTLSEADDRTRRLLCLRFAWPTPGSADADRPMTLPEAAGELGISVERARGLEQRGMRLAEAAGRPA